MMERAIVVVSRVFGVYLWQHRQAEDDGWFDRRMDLLQRITLPALSRVRVPFVWVWQAHRTKIELVADRIEQIDLCGIDVRLVDQHLKTCDDIWPGVDKFMTFRVDTDDAWLPSAIDDMAGSTFDDRTLVDFRRGVALDWSSGEMRHRSFSHQGPFLAVTQDRDLMLDFGGNHRKAREGRAVKHIDTISWIQVVHGGNAVNHMPREPSQEAYKREGIHADGAQVASHLYREILAASGVRLDVDPRSAPRPRLRLRPRRWVLWRK
jgi:hypothetical protein